MDRPNELFLTLDHKYALRNSMQATTMTKESPQAAPTTLKYLCPLCPGVVSNEAGDCPTGGMALEQNPAWKPAPSKSIYSVRCSRNWLDDE